ncbi:MAG: hypothetical protein E3J72_08145 [Planctomycetota bacterium]|nr:MAG: hypothetical protein E3J72_08145 [Planctomycetota bacterium]
MITEWITAIAAIIGTIGTILGALGYKRRGKKLNDVSTALEETGRRVVNAEEVIRALVIAIEKFRTDVRKGHYGNAARNDLPDIARLIQAFAEELDIEKNLADYVKELTE